MKFVYDIEIFNTKINSMVSIRQNIFYLFGHDKKYISINLS